MIEQLKDKYKIIQGLIHLVAMEAAILSLDNELSISRVNLKDIHNIGVIVVNKYYAKYNITKAEV